MNPTIQAPLDPAVADGELGWLQELQRAVDARCWSTSESDRAKLRHISFHLTIAAGKMARIEERADHGEIDEAVLDDVAADLLSYALQIATIRDRELGSLYAGRIAANIGGRVKHR